MTLRTAPALDIPLTAQTPHLLCTAAWITRWFESPTAGYRVTDGARLRSVWRDWVPATLQILCSVAIGLLLGALGLGQVWGGETVGWAYLVAGLLIGVLSAVALTRRVTARRRAARAVAAGVGPAAVAAALATVALPVAVWPSAALAAGVLQPVSAGALCRPGQRLEVVDFGKWHPAVVIAVRNDGYSPCRVHWIGYATTMDSWVPLSYLRASGAGRAEPMPGGPDADDPTLDSIRGARGGGARARPAQVAAGDYNCVSFVGPVTGGGHLVHVGDFTITGPGAYRSRGTSGTYAYDARTGLVRFLDGPWGGQRANYDAVPHPAVHVLGPSGRTAEDCDGPAR